MHKIITVFDPIESNKLIAEFMGWKFIKGSKVGIDGYPFGGHDGFELSDVWVLNPTEKYLNNPCHYHYEYMDGKYNDDIEQSDLFEDYTYENGLEYHSSWDWLMPVVEKIENLNYTVTITQNICTIKACVMGDRTVISHQTGNYTAPNTKLYNTRIAVIEFINWYNKQIEKK